MNELLLEYLGEIRDLGREHQVKSLVAFGMSAIDADQEPEKVELLVSFEDNLQLDSFADNYFSLRQGLTGLFEREVELLVENALSNPYLRAFIDQNNVIIYG